MSASYDAVQALREIAKRVPQLKASVSDEAGPIYECSWSYFGAMESVALMRAVTREAVTEALCGNGRIDLPEVLK